MKKISCQLCFTDFDAIQFIDGKRYTLYGRHHCLKCVPLGTRAPIYAGKLSYSKQDLRDAVGASTSMRQTLLKLGLKDAATNYRSVRRMCVYWQISTEHFTGQGWSSGVKRGHRRPLSEYLANLHPIGSDALKKRLVNEGVLQYKCSKCQGITWNDLPIPIELDHINGNHEDNSLSNLRILCPNCHAQTSTHGGKNKR